MAVMSRNQSAPSAPGSVREDGAPAEPSFVAKLQQAAKLANENCDRATILAHTLSSQLREAQSRINQLEAAADGLADRLWGEAETALAKLQADAKARIERTKQEADARIARVESEAESRVRDLEATRAGTTTHRPGEGRCTVSSWQRIRGRRRSSFEIAGNLVAAARLHPLPEMDVIVVLAGIVEEPGILSKGPFTTSSSDLPSHSVPLRRLLPLLT